MRNLLTSCFLLLAINVICYAQSVMPVAINRSVISIPVPDTASLLQEDSIFDDDPSYPRRIGIVTNLSANTSNSGELTLLDDGTSLWTLPIYAQGAKSIGIILDKMNLSSGDTLRLFNAAGYAIGTWTNRDNTSSKKQMPLSIGDKALLVLKTNPNNHSDLHIQGVCYNYRNAFRRVPYRNSSSDDQCSIQAALSDVTEEKQASCIMIFVRGTSSYACTGQLVNNTNGDNTPLLLGAYHCVNSDDDAATLVTYWNTESPLGVSDIMGSTEQYILGATLTEARQDVDMSLLTLSSFPSKSFRPYLMGWNRTSEVNPPFHGIHHPQGSNKRVTECTSSISTNSSIVDYDGLIMPVGSLWQISAWTTGTTASGSSGSALLDADNHLIGTLVGGASTCSAPNNDFYSTFKRQWNTGLLSAHLDNAGTGATTLDGRNPYGDEAASRVTMLTPTTASAATQLSSVSGATRFAQRITLDAPATLIGLYITSYNGKIPSNVTISRCLNSTESTASITISAPKIPVWRTSSSSFVYYTEASQSLLAKSDTYVPTTTAGINVGDEFFVIFDVSDDAFPYATMTPNDGAFVERDGVWEPLACEVSQNTIWIDAVTTPGWTGDTQIATTTCSDTPSDCTSAVNDIFIFPSVLNAGESITIRNPSGKAFTANLYDSAGNRINSQKSDGHDITFQIPVSGRIVSGAYFINVSGASDNWTKIIIAH